MILPVVKNRFGLTLTSNALLSNIARFIVYTRRCILFAIVLATPQPPFCITSPVLASVRVRVLTIVDTP